MSEFRKVTNAQRSPTRCVLCGSHEGPFLDTNVDLPVYGRLNICGANDQRPGCVQQMARLDGVYDQAELSQVTELLVQSEARVTELESALRERKLPVGELLTALGVS